MGRREHHPQITLPAASLSTSTNDCSVLGAGLRRMTEIKTAPFPGRQELVK